MLRVSEVLEYFQDPHLVEWKIKVGKKEARRLSTMALKIGSRVDDLIKGRGHMEKNESQEVRNCMEAYHRWRMDYDPMSLMFPERLYDEDRQITGEPDCLWVAKNTLIDFKTSARVSWKYWLQLSAYASMLELLPEKLAVLRLDKNLGEYQYLNNEEAGFDIQRGIEAFNGLLVAYRFRDSVTGRDKMEEESNGSDESRSISTGGGAAIANQKE